MGQCCWDGLSFCHGGRRLSRFCRCQNQRKNGATLRTDWSHPSRAEYPADRKVGAAADPHQPGSFSARDRRSEAGERRGCPPSRWLLDRTGIRHRRRTVGRSVDPHGSFWRTCYRRQSGRRASRQRSRYGRSRGGDGKIRSQEVDQGIRQELDWTCRNDGRCFFRRSRPLRGLSEGSHQARGRRTRRGRT